MQIEQYGTIITGFRSKVKIFQDIERQIAVKKKIKKKQWEKLLTSDFI